MFGRTLRCLCTLPLLLGTPLLAAGPECSRYSEFGLALGMTNKQVWRAMGHRGEEEGRERGSSGYRSIERYEGPKAPVLVHYDGTVGKKSSARVVAIETTFSSKVVGIPDLTTTLRDRLGEPSSGAANLDDGLKAGAVQWTNPECDVQVTLFRRAASWWEPTGSAEFHVKIAALSFVQTGQLNREALRTAAVPEPPQAVSPAAANPVAEPAAENPALASASTDGHERGSDESAESASPIEPAASEDSAIYMAGVDGVSHPVRLPGRTPPPRLPAAARSRTLDGKVILEVVVRKDGKVGDITVLQVSPVGLGLEQAAIRAVKRWRYRPAELDGRPVDARVDVSFRFE